MISASKNGWGNVTRLPYFGNEWAIILAGGDGTRLKSLTRTITGDERPKQFCPILGGETLLEQTYRRTEVMIAPQRTLFVLNSPHEPFYRSILGNMPAHRLVAQPRNRGTAPAVLYGLLRVAAVSPSASVAIFPSDHFVSNDMAFMSHVGAAFHHACRKPDSVVLLGIKPEYPEIEYGWIEPVDVIFTDGAYEVMGVERFWEKPSSSTAKELLAHGGLWNSFVMIGRVSAFLSLIKSGAPELYGAFKPIVRKLGSEAERKAIEKLYSDLPLTNFSDEVLASSSASLGVLPVQGTRWSDLGAPDRVFRCLDFAGIEPAWTECRASA